MAKKTLAIGFLGSGFVARFHIASWIGVRDADVRGVFSPNPERAGEAAALARSRGVGEAKAFASIESIGPSRDRMHLALRTEPPRAANMEAIVEALESNKGELLGIACEKPLGRNLAEAKRVRDLVKRAGVLDGYLENQVFAPAVVRGKDLLWPRSAELGASVDFATAELEDFVPAVARGAWNPRS